MKGCCLNEVRRKKGGVGQGCLQNNQLVLPILFREKNIEVIYYSSYSL